MARAARLRAGDRATLSVPRTLESRTRGGRGNGPHSAGRSHLPTARRCISAQGAQTHLHAHAGSLALAREAGGHRRAGEAHHALAGVIEIYTDGACRGNPGPGGWAALLLKDGHERELSGAEALTTNNRMELTAVIRALEALKRPVQARVLTDSEYVRRGISEWLPGWQARGWRTAARKPVKNQDLWQQLAVLAAAHTLEWRWIPGHAGIAGNERVDRLANRAIDALQQGMG
ncbi:MAG: ribonuclease HI [Gammaproteobacteria bacterium]|nr:ribonuclease HI [Gammaproteobacteria bacterium]